MIHLVSGRDGSRLFLNDDGRLIPLEPRDGRQRGQPIDLGSPPSRFEICGIADLDGDGEPDFLAFGPGTTADNLTLQAFSGAGRRVLWTRTDATCATIRNFQVPGWNWTCDLDRDGRADVVVPATGTVPPAVMYQGIQLLDGRDGMPRWVRAMQPDDPSRVSLLSMLKARDLDGDGVRDLVAVSTFAGRSPQPRPGDPGLEPSRLYADAISSRDGRLLWSWHLDLMEDKVTPIPPPHWWGVGTDGRPLLAVSVGGPHDPSVPLSFQPAAVHVLEATTGRELHRIPGLARTSAADLDGDGLVNLWGDADGELVAFRGEPPEAWRSLDGMQPAWQAQEPHGWSRNSRAVDLDGDGVGDTLSARLKFQGNPSTGAMGTRTALARSGRDGHLLWKTTLDPPRHWFDADRSRTYELAAFPPPQGDLDGDGTPDVIVRKSEDVPPANERRPATLPLQALSGRTGRPLWSAGPLPLGFEAYGETILENCVPHSDRPGAPPDLLVRHLSPLIKGVLTTSTGGWQRGYEHLAGLGAYGPHPLGRRYQRPPHDAVASR